MSALSSITRQQDVAGSSQQESARLEQARNTAVSFEGVTIGELLQPMFDTINTDDNMFSGGAAEEQFRSLQVLEMGKQIANSGGIGIADSVYRQILAMQEQAQSS
ncbi:rod-binding protein [Gluconacetobacter takamatsuzukensis]|nr:rod-binding protein [Gluconacetobacter takamatsuzukensis]